MDNPASSNSTIILITNDHGYVYPMNILRARKYRVIVLATSEADAGLKHKGDNFIDWERVVLGPIRKNSSRSNKSPVNVSPSSAAWTQSTTPSPSPRCKRSPTYSPSGGSSMEPLNPHQPPFLVVSKTPNIPAYGHPPQRETTTLMQGSTPPISNEPESPPMIRRMVSPPAYPSLQRDNHSSV